MLFWIGVVLVAIGLLGYFMGTKEMAGLSDSSGKLMLTVGVVLGIILILAGTFVEI